MLLDSNVSRMKGNKQIAIVVLWTVIAVLIGIFLFFRREKKSVTQTGRPVVTPGTSRAVSMSSAPVKRETDKFVLVTLNDTLVASDTMELIPHNVSAFRKMADACGAKTGGLIVMFSVPEGVIGESETNAPDTVKSTIEKRLDEAGIFACGLKNHRIVYTKSIEGRISVGRQIEAHIFLDSDRHVVDELTGKVPHVVHVSSETFKSFVNGHAFFSQNSVQVD